MNGDLESLKLLIGQKGADIHARAQGRFFMPEDCKDRVKPETNYDGEWTEWKITEKLWHKLNLLHMAPPTFPTLLPRDCALVVMELIWV